MYADLVEIGSIPLPLIRVNVNSILAKIQVYTQDEKTIEKSKPRMRLNKGRYNCHVRLGIMDSLS